MSSRGQESALVVVPESFLFGLSSEELLILWGKKGTRQRIKKES